MLLALYKPYDVLTQFTPDHPGQRTLAECGLPPHVYSLGRLDRDSEGLLLLSDEPGLNTRLLDPKRGHRRLYHVQVDGEITPAALRELEAGVLVQGERTRPARALRLEPPDWPPRDPPVRFRKNIPTSWISLELTEGKNRQVRRMTAAVGFPTLRLLRASIGTLQLSALGLAPGRWVELGAEERRQIFA